MSKKLAIKILVQDDVSGGDTPDIAIVHVWNGQPDPVTVEIEKE